MILADKIIRLRKRNGWSQEELAEKMGVSRQAVSKWESAQSTPDLEKILQLSALFGVTTDYLLKEEMEEVAFTDDPLFSVKRVSLDEAAAFLAWRRKASIRIALATFLCILSVIPLLLLGAAAGVPAFGISENLAGGIGLITLFIIAAIAVAIYIVCGFQNEPYRFLEKEPFEIEYGVRGMVREQQKAYRNTYIKLNVFAVCLCVLSPTALFVGVFFPENEFFVVVMLTLMLLLAGIGVMLFLIAGVRWASMRKLLQEGEFSQEGKEKSRIKEAVGTVYWLIATAVYLGWSFLSNDWHITWLVWPIAGVLFAGVMVLCNLVFQKKEQSARKDYSG